MCVYSGRLQRNSSLSVLDEVFVRCSLGQLVVRSSINPSIDFLKALCRAHNVRGYSKTNPLAKELFLHALLWPCEHNCNHSQKRPPNRQDPSAVCWR
ncbi:BQ2448_5230 [Microbotryum intermedium]|uniref:BQ2448_5230 protein n=1 Tax=Microbotryum intermedium TaxID=269621 RepID=A0A238F4I5_9BASI|nr:BQ2448_5230 [Microbotryum intermedium]